MKWFEYFLEDRIEDDFWISLTDLGSANSWYWDSNGGPIYFSKWGDAEPNNVGSERCVLTNAYSRDWENADCDDAKKYVCEGYLPRT